LIQLLPSINIINIIMSSNNMSAINMDTLTKCVLCFKLKNMGYGNNPAPLRPKGRCCDKCNFEKVLPFRMGLGLKGLGEYKES
jgi:hypothetical protein